MNFKAGASSSPLKKVTRRPHCLPSPRRTTKLRIARHPSLPPPPSPILRDSVTTPWRLRNHPPCSRAPLRPSKRPHLLAAPQVATALFCILQIIPFLLRSISAVFVATGPRENITEFSGENLIRNHTGNPLAEVFVTRAVRMIALHTCVLPNNPISARAVDMCLSLYSVRTILRCAIGADTSCTCHLWAYRRALLCVSKYMVCGRCLCWRLIVEG